MLTGRGSDVDSARARLEGSITLLMPFDAISKIPTWRYTAEYPVDTHLAVFIYRIYIVDYFPNYLLCGTKPILQTSQLTILRISSAEPILKIVEDAEPVNQVEHYSQ